jgi:uncharacterized protein (DUF433 family)
MTAVQTSHIVLDDRGRAWVEGTNTKVVEIVLDKLAYGWSPEEIHRQHPHLPLAKIHSAFAYYYDHQGEIDAEIERQEGEFEKLKAQVADSPLRKRLRAMGKLP